MRALGSQREEVPPEAAAGVVEQWLHRGAKGVMLPSSELDDLAILRLDGFACVLLLLHVQPTLEGDRVRDRALHGALKARRPGVEGGAMQEDRSRDIEVIAQRVKAMKLVHAVGHGVRERVLLRVYGASGDHLDRLGEVHAHRHRAQKLEGPRLYFAR